MSTVIAVADQHDGELRPAGGQAIAAARALAGGEGTVVLLVVGPTPTVGFAGVDRVLAGGSGEDLLPATLAQMAIAAAAAADATAIVFSHGPDAMGAAPAVAVKLGAALVTDVIGIAVEDGVPFVTRRLYGGKVAAELALPAGSAAVVTVQNGAFPAPDTAPLPTAEPLPEPVADAVYEHLGYVEPASGEVDISRVELLVAAGRGIGERENLERFEQLAEALGGELAVSRPLVDAGWAPAARQVGQSGRTVKPKVYLAFGISGAVQHLAGIRDAGLVIAVNSDAGAPIYRVADYGAVADALTVAAGLERAFNG